MKKYYLALASFAIISCNKEPKGYLDFSGKIENFSKNSAVEIYNKTGYKKIIKLKSDGSFNDSMNLQKGRYAFVYKGKYTPIYLENDQDLELNLDFKDFDNSIKYTGEAAAINQFLKKTSELTQKGLGMDDLSLDSINTTKKIENLRSQLATIIASNSSISDAIKTEIKANFEREIKGFLKYKAQKEKADKAFPKGGEVVNFSYENTEGKTVQLSDLKGKLTYIDVWATWCGPCKAEIPALKKLEKEFHGKDINFVSISVDPTNKKDIWLEFTKKKELGGIQLFADNSFRSKFIQELKINSIPRFILLDKEGKIINVNAPRPSNPNIQKLLNDNL